MCLVYIFNFLCDPDAFWFFSKGVTIMNTVYEYVRGVIINNYEAGTCNCASSDPEVIYDRLIELLLEQGWRSPTDEEWIPIVDLRD